MVSKSLHIIKSLTRLATVPFRRHFLFLVALTLLGTGTDALWNAYVYEKYAMACLVLMQGFLICYIATLFTTVLRPRALGRVCRALLLAAATLSFMLNFYCVMDQSTVFDRDYAAILLDSNAGEAMEFMSSVLPLWIVIAEVLVLALFTILFIFRKRFGGMNLGRYGSIVALALVACALVLSLVRRDIWRNGTIHRAVSFANYKPIGDLRTFYRNHTVTFYDSTTRPRYVVLIIGESLARYHCSLYGYEKATTPFLDSLAASGQVWHRDSVSSPAHSTALALRYMLTTERRLKTAITSTDNVNAEMGKHPTVIELLQNCGYSCHWISAQPMSGRHNSVARAVAELCESSRFLRKHNIVSRDDMEYDDVVLPEIEKLLASNNDNKPQFAVVHLMGSHFDYSMRYPASAAHFSTLDYSDKPVNQREVLASYDNSVRYNDYVVSRILHLMEGQDAVVVYLPDHGQDIYRSDPSYAAHGRPGKPESYAYGTEIPFIVFLTPEFESRHSELSHRIHTMSSSPWISDDLPYALLDLVGVEKIDGESVRQHSCF